MSGDDTLQNHSPLNVTRESTHRIFVGLGWDPNETPTLKDKVGAIIGKREHHHDLDLTCYYFNQDNACLGFVSGEVPHNTNPSGSIYHSGDSIEGIGDGDDEQISVELKNLPPNIHHLIFKASIKSGHSFGDVAEPEIRLCDGYTGRCFSETFMTDDSGKNSDSFVFVRVSRGASADEWYFDRIDSFANMQDQDDWGDALSRFTIKPTTNP